jgi:hypothetical protein
MTSKPKSPKTVSTPSIQTKYVRFFFSFIVSCSSFVVHCTLAQLPNQALNWPTPFDSASVKKLGFRFNALGFVKNNEYFGPIADGYTLWAYQLNPQLTYQPAQGVLLAGGIFLQKNFGDPDFVQTIVPTFSIQFERRNWLYRFGTLDGATSHRLIEPLYNFERLLRARVENGLQVTHQTNRSFFDLWVSYPQNTLPGYTRQEQFWGGISGEWQVASGKWLTTNRNVEPHFSLTTPIQLTAFHEGGQNLAVTATVRTAINGAAAMSLSWQSAQKQAFMQGGRFDLYGTFYTETADASFSGTGFYPNLRLDMRPFSVLFSYWNGHTYRAEYGGDLYQSYSRFFGSSRIEPRRRLLIVRFLRDFDIADGLTATVRFEPHYDFGNGLFEHSEAVYLTYRFKTQIGRK